MAALWHLAAVANPPQFPYAALPLHFLQPAMFDMHAQHKFVMQMAQSPAFLAPAPSPPLSNPELVQVVPKMPAPVPVPAPIPAPVPEAISTVLSVDADRSVPIPLELLEDCRHREERCANALRIPSLEVDFPADPEAHVFASVFGTMCKSCADKSTACRHAKVKFNSTSNSKRRVHVMLFWRRALGPNFPISDVLLQDNVWRQLDSCRFGIKRSNGHSKVNGHVCINPAHYEPADYDCILDVLIDYISRLGVYPACRRVVAVVSLRQALGAEATFRALCDALRQLVFTPYTREGAASGGESVGDAHSPGSPVDQAAALVVRRKKSSSARKPSPY